MCIPCFTRKLNCKIIFDVSLLSHFMTCLRDYILKVRLTLLNEFVLEFEMVQVMLQSFSPRFPPRYFGLRIIFYQFFMHFLLPKNILCSVHQLHNLKFICWTLMLITWTVVGYLINIHTLRSPRKSLGINMSLLTRERFHQFCFIERRENKQYSSQFKLIWRQFFITLQAYWLPFFCIPRILIS